MRKRKCYLLVVGAVVLIVLIIIIAVSARKWNRANNGKASPPIDLSADSNFLQVCCPVSLGYYSTLGVESINQGMSDKIMRVNISTFCSDDPSSDKPPPQRLGGGFFIARWLRPSCWSKLIRSRLGHGNSHSPQLFCIGIILYAKLARRDKQVMREACSITTKTGFNLKTCQ